MKKKMILYALCSLLIMSFAVWYLNPVEPSAAYVDNIDKDEECSGDNCYDDAKDVDLEFYTQGDEVNEEKEVYLTFDDGPSVVTNRILDILKENDVKATFFVIGIKISGNEDILQRMVKEGHTIGLHTYSHKYNKIYCSDEAFLNEMEKSKEEIKAAVGISPTIMRFPFGSKGHLTPALAKKIKDLNYRVYDWNVPLEDGIDPRISPEKLYRQGTNLRYFKSPIIVLAHCSRENVTTCQALTGIIKYYKDNGFKFKVIDDNTPEYRFKMKSEKKKVK